MLHLVADTNMTRSAEIATQQEEIIQSITKESLVLKELQETSYAADSAYTVRPISTRMHTFTRSKYGVKNYAHLCSQKNYLGSFIKKAINSFVFWEFSFL